MTKVTFSSWSDSSRKMAFCCFWIRSRIRACGNKPSEAEQLLDLFQYIILFALHQFSSSNLHYKASISWSLAGLDERPVSESDRPLDKTRFLSLLTAHREWPNFSSWCFKLWNGKGRPEKLCSLQSLSTSSGLLRWLPQGQVTFGQNVLLIHILILNACCIVSI